MFSARVGVARRHANNFFVGRKQARYVVHVCILDSHSAHQECNARSLVAPLIPAFLRHLCTALLLLVLLVYAYS